MTSARLGHDSLDYSGFGPAMLFVTRKTPLQGLLEVYERLEPGQAQANMRAGLCDVMEQLREPPAAETMLIFAELLKLAGAIRATDALTVLDRRFAGGNGWRQSAATYHPALQFAYNVETHRQAATLVRTVIGTARHRSEHFETAQIRPALRAMVSSDPAALVRHLQFFEPEVRDTSYEVQQAIASEIFSLRDKTLSEQHWAEASTQLPDWFALAVRGLAQDTAQLVRQSIGEVFAAYHTTAPGVVANHTNYAEKRLQRALRAAANISHSALLYAVDQVREESDGHPLPDWARKAIEPHASDIDKHLSEALQPLLHLQSLQRFMMHRVHRTEPLRPVPRLPLEGNTPLDDVLNHPGGHKQSKDGKP